MKFSELQDQLKEKFGIDHLADIARELGVSPQAVSYWKASDRVPYKYVIKIRGQRDFLYYAGIQSLTSCQGAPRIEQLRCPPPAHQTGK